MRCEPDRGLEAGCGAGGIPVAQMDETVAQVSIRQMRRDGLRLRERALRRAPIPGSVDRIGAGGAADHVAVVGQNPHHVRHAGGGGIGVPETACRVGEIGLQFGAGAPQPVRRLQCRHGAGGFAGFERVLAGERRHVERRGGIAGRRFRQILRDDRLIVTHRFLLGDPGAVVVFRAFVLGEPAIGQQAGDHRARVARDLGELRAVEGDGAGREQQLRSGRVCAASLPLSPWRCAIIRSISRIRER